MGRKKYKKKIIENVEIIDVVAEGKCLAKQDDMVIFVTGVIPGDIVDVLINKKKPNYLEGRPLKFHKYSKKRIDAFCKHFGICGGCKWQNLPYELQTKYKQKQVSDNFAHLGKFIFPDVMPILKSPKTINYRNKLEYTFSNRRWLMPAEIENKDAELNYNGLGFHIPKMFDKIIDIEECFLQPSPSNEIRLAIKEFAVKNNFTFFDIRNHTGLLRNLIIRTSATTNDLMVIVVFYENDKEKINKILNFIDNSFPEITSLMYVINQKLNDSISDQEVILFKGNDSIIETMGKLKFKIGPKSFYQTNSEQAFNLYNIVKSFANISSNDIVYDLYTGTGTIANFVAKQAKKVIGLEYIPEAIEDAKINSKINNITNTEFYAGDIKDLLSFDFISQKGIPDIIILDPPRAGVHKKVITSMLFAKPSKIVYVSCNPATQVRDINLLADFYNVKKIQPVDMFPHTHHVENVVLLELKK